MPKVLLNKREVDMQTAEASVEMQLVFNSYY